MGVLIHIFALTHPFHHLVKYNIQPNQIRRPPVASIQIQEGRLTINTAIPVITAPMPSILFMLRCPHTQPPPLANNPRLFYYIPYVLFVIPIFRTIIPLFNYFLLIFLLHFSGWVICRWQTLLPVYLLRL